MDILGQLRKMIELTFRSGAWSITLKGKAGLSKDITVEIADGDATQTMVTDSSVATLTNKTIDSAGAGNSITLDADAAGTTISNIDNDEIKAGAAIDATKIHDGSVSNTEFGYLDGVTSSIQTQLDTDAQNLTDHEAEVTGAHASSAISYNNATSGLTATNAQAALDEVEGRLDTAETNISTNASDLADHEAETVAAHAASAILFANVSSGLAATNAQAAIDEVEGRLDTAESNISSNDTDITNLQNDKADKTTTVTGTGAISGGGDLSANRTLDVAALGIDTARLAANAVTDAKVNDVAASKLTGNHPTLGLDTAVVAISANNVAVPSTATHITLTGTGPVNSFSGASAGRYLQIQNTTGSALVFTNGASLITGTADNIEIADDATIIVYYDGTAYNVVGGTGGGSGGLELVYVNDTDSPVTGEIGKHYLTDTTSGAITINLPDASALSAAQKKVATIRVTDSAETWTDNNVTLVPNSGETIDGFAVDESLVLDVSGSWLEISWDNVNAHWALNLAGSGGGAGGGLSIEEYAYNGLPATLELDVHYLVDFGNGSSLNAAATMPAIGTDSGSIKVTPINSGGGCTVTLTRSGSDQFNDPDLGLDTEYVLDVGSATFVTNVNDSTWETLDNYWATAQDAGETLYSEIVLVNSETSTVSDISRNGNANNSGFRFENLVIGKKYRLTMQGQCSNSGTGSTEETEFIAIHNAVEICVVSERTDSYAASDTRTFTLGNSTIFTAAATEVTFDVTVAGTGGLSSLGGRSKAILEELPQHVKTTKFSP